VTVYFDGRCPLCRREIAHYRRLDRAGLVRWVDLHSAGPELEHIGVQRRAARQRLHVLDRDRRLHTGVGAFAVIWDLLPGYRWLSRLVRTRGLVPVLERGYASVTRWRTRPRCHRAGAMTRLRSDDAAWVAGPVLPVDGGFTAVRPMVKG